MKVSGKKIIGGSLRSIINEMKTDKHSDAKKKFMREAIDVAKKHTK